MMADTTAHRQGSVPKQGSEKLSSSSLLVDEQIKDELLTWLLSLTAEQRVRRIVDVLWHLNNFADENGIKHVNMNLT